MTSTEQKSANVISLKGSAAIVSEFFYYGINNILFQRGIYPPEMFTREKKYGLTILVSTDPKIRKYLDNILPQLTEWLELGKVKRICVVIKNVHTSETLERWQFNVSCDKENFEPNAKPGNKDISKINSEIQAVIRQITATVTFLPLLDCTCSFDVLFYTDESVSAPEKWENSSPCLIENSEVVQLRSFSTSVHKVDGAVSYKYNMF